jgi:hypothetical protein
MRAAMVIIENISKTNMAGITKQVVSALQNSKMEMNMQNQSSIKIDTSRNK